MDKTFNKKDYLFFCSISRVPINKSTADQNASSAQKEKKHDHKIEKESSIAINKN